MNLHVLTRCTRPENLEPIHESFKGNVLTWHVVFDVSVVSELDTKLLGWLYSVAQVYFKSGEQGSYMYPLLNELVVDNIPQNDWVAFIDDDNIMHPDFYESIKKRAWDNSYLAICYNQLVDLNSGSTRVASPQNTVVGGIDLAQYAVSALVFHYKLASFKSGYTGDGELISELHGKKPDYFLFLDKTLCYYNYLQQVAPKKTSAPKVLYIGEGKPDLKSLSHLGYEDTSLNVDHNKEYFYKDFDSIVSVGKELAPSLMSANIDIRRRWVHFEDEPDNLGEIAYNVAMNYILSPKKPAVSFFTPAYNTPTDRLMRLWDSIRNQTVGDWEWVIVNDSPKNKKLSNELDLISQLDSRVKVFTFEKPSGGTIGDVKYKAASLCSGDLLAEVDHDDELALGCADYLIQAMKAHPQCGFFYTDCVELNENMKSMKYPDGFAFGYGKYRTLGDWDVSVCVGINPKTIRHIVGVPNHVRAWRRDVYNKIGGHNRRLTIADDYELIVRTFLETRFCHIEALGYIQYIYNNSTGQNTHDATRGDIQRRVRTIMYHYNHEIAERFYYLGVEDWAYKFNPNNPLLSPSKFGDKEGSVNVPFVPNT